MKRFLKSNLTFTLVTVGLLATILAASFMSQGIFVHASGPSKGATTARTARMGVNSPLNQFAVQNLSGGTQVAVYDGDQLLTGSTDTTTMSGFTVHTGDVAKTTWVVGDGQCGTATVPLPCVGGRQTVGTGDTAGFTGGSGSLTIGPDAFRGSDPCSWGPDTCLWDTRTADVTNYVSSGDTSVTATVTSADAGDGADCLNHYAQVFSTGPTTAASSEGYVAAGVGLRNQGSGNISLSGIPSGAHVVQALLYWSILDPSNPGGTMSMNGQPINSTLIDGTQGDPCWGAQTTWAFRSDVTTLVASAGGNGTYTLSGYPTGDTSGGNPWDNASPIPMAEGASLIVIYERPVTPPRQLIVFLQGITTSLNSKQANQGVIVGMSNVPNTIKKVFPAASTLPNANTRFLEYSYFGSRTDNGLPSAYNCVDTLTNPLFVDILGLDKQIKNALKVEPQGTDVNIYLIGHSLGGVLALGYLEFLEQGGLFVSLPANAHLKAVITLDSPIGGVAPGFLSIFSALGTRILEQQCPAAKGLLFTAPKELETIYGSSSTTTQPESEDSGTNPQGSQASILAEAATVVTTLPNPLPSNENLVERAQADLGTSFLSIGNLNDFLFDPNACANALPSFLDTMFLEDDGNGSGLYGRDFVSGSGTCPGILNIKRTTQIVMANHSAVLSNGNVQLGIQNFLTALVSGSVGGTPSPLVVNPFESPGS